MRSWGRLLFIFLDGVGIGEDDPGKNPFTPEAAPTLSRLLGGSLPSLRRPALRGPGAVSFPLDATLGVEGTPQSGTGQAALLTGTNAARSYGRHFGPWTPVRLRPLVAENSVLRMALDAGRRVTFANAYPRGWPGKRGGRRVAGPPLAAQGAGLMTRHEEALGAGEAVSSEIVNDGWKSHLGYDWLPDVTPEEAGGNLASVASDADLTLYAHYSTDTAGHRGGMKGAVAALTRVDRFLKGILTKLPSDMTMLLASDHGNLEDVTVGHTRNPALGLAVGPGAVDLSAAESLLDVTPAILRHLTAGD
ncbi:MAG: hypothetical protein HKO53_17850 [Gemmatimonadetes bacterium]|nr:hypothetical protein [Gemmatimonadota bacterium]